MGFLSRNKKQLVTPVTSRENYQVSIPLNLTTEKFKGGVVQKKVLFPKELGVEHPFNFAECEGLYKKFGFVTGVIDKYVDFIVSGFFVKSKDERAQQIIEDWMQDVDFDMLLRSYVKEALVKGNAFLEITSGGEVKILDSKYMFVDRNDNGEIQGYNQYVGYTENRIVNLGKITPFKTKEVAHLSINRIGNDAYGEGIVHPAMDLINDFLCAQKELHSLMKRKANTPIIATVGDLTTDPPSIPPDGTVEALGKELESLNNKQEWAVGPGVKFSTLNFGNIGERFSFILDHDAKMLFFAFQVPEVLMGSGSIPEGLAGVQMDAWQRNIASKQAEIEKVIEQKIFKPLLLTNGLDVHVEFEWGRPSDDEKNRRIDLLLRILSNPMLTSGLQDEAVMDLAAQLGYDVEKIQLAHEAEMEVRKQELEDKKAELEREREEERPQPIVPGQNKNTPKPVSDEEEFYSHSLNHVEEASEYTLTEWIGFNYQKYTDEILYYIENDPYTLLAAVTEQEVLLGKLSAEQIQSLKQVLRESFQEGWSMRDIAKQIKKEVNPGSLIITDDQNNIRRIISEKIRPIIIARTETIRAANGGAAALYKKSGITQYSWISALSNRTCPVCEELNGKVFDIDSNVKPPKHVMCRCTISAITELNVL